MPNTWWVYHILQTLRRIMYLFSLNNQHNIYTSSSNINWPSPPPFISANKLWPLWWQRPCLLLTAISKIQFNEAIWSVCREKVFKGWMNWFNTSASWGKLSKCFTYMMWNTNFIMEDRLNWLFYSKHAGMVSQKN